MYESGEDTILETLMASPTMHSVYVCLPVEEKFLMVGQAIELSATTMKSEQMITLLTRAPYAACTLFSLANIDTFAQYEGSSTFCTNFESALDNTTPYELEQLARFGFYENILYFYNDIQSQWDESSAQTQTANKLF